MISYLSSGRAEKRMNERFAGQIYVKRKGWVAWVLDAWKANTFISIISCMLLVPLLHHGLGKVF
jgi:hypothetical protein